VKQYWQLKVKRPSTSDEVLDLRVRRSVKVGDDSDNDIVVDSTLIPFQFPMLRMKGNRPLLRLTDDIKGEFKGESKQLKLWKTRLYHGVEIEVLGESRWMIGDTRFVLKRADSIPLEGIRHAVNPEERKQFFQAFAYSAAFYASVFLVFLTYSVIRSFFPPSVEELSVQRVSLVQAEKVFKKPVPLVVETLPPVVEEKPVEAPKEVAVAKSTQLKMKKAAKTTKTAPGKTQGSKKRDVQSMGLLAIQTTPGASRIAMAVASPQVVDRASDASMTSLGLGSAVSGIGIGEGNSQQVARLGSISGSTYQGGLGDKLATSKNPSIALARREVVVRGALDPAVIRQIIEERLPEIRYCYETALLKNSDLAGKISASWTIQATGDVANIQSVSEEIQKNVLHPCVKEQISKWKFPNPKGGGLVHVKYPFLFNPVGGSR